jgi:Mce-associated membrane protein
MTEDESSATKDVDEVDEPTADVAEEHDEPATDDNEATEAQDDPAADDTDDTDTDEKAPEETPSRYARLTRRIPRQRAKVASIALAVLVVAATALAGWVYWYQYRPAQHTVVFTSDLKTTSPAAKAVLAAATNGTTSLLSYSPDTVDRDLAAAKTHLTGEFLDYYSKFTDQIVAPAAKQKGVKTTATVVQGAVSELHQDSAVVLLFVNQATTSKDRPEPNLTASSVVVRLEKINDNWLISKFDPV